MLIFRGCRRHPYSFGTILEFMVEGHLTAFWRERRMQKWIMRCASPHRRWHRLGRSIVAKSLADEGVPFVIIDSARSVRCAEEAGWLFVHGAATRCRFFLEGGGGRASAS